MVTVSKNFNPHDKSDIYSALVATQVALNDLLELAFHEGLRLSPTAEVFTGHWGAPFIRIQFVNPEENEYSYADEEETNELE